MKQIILCKKFRSTRKSIDELEYMLHSLKDLITMPNTQYYNVYLCIFELFINAVYHGNCLDSSKYVELIIEKQDNKLTITIIDQGKGFSVEDVPDPLATENLLKDSGRGIFIVKNYANFVTYKYTQRGFCSVITFEN